MFVHRLIYCAVLGVLSNGIGMAVEPTELVAKAQQQRIDTIAKVRPAVVAVCFYGGKACGSGVLIDPDGYALTNYHVVEPTGPVMQCGLPDGKLYDAVLVGTDKVGDVALIKLLPNKKGTPFPFVKLGNSDKVRAGDWSLAMGNPFGLSIDFTPTVTYGLVSGVNRYQPPAGSGTLEYTDCIQVETSINPGNSGGPLFNMDGELIGINGRGSFEKRGRVNSGVGYAISINQIKNFLGALKAGLETDHATLGAIVETADEAGDLSRMIVKQVLEESDVYRRGLEVEDQIVRFAGRPMTSTNQYKNVLGIFPKGWRLPLTIRRNGETREMLVRLMGNIDTPAASVEIKPAQPTPKPSASEDSSKSPAKKLYKAKKGFANYYFNELQQKQIQGAFAKHGTFNNLKGDWTMLGQIDLVNRKGNIKLSWKEPEQGLAKIIIDRNGIVDEVTPLQPDQSLAILQTPTGSGGLLVSLYLYRRLLIEGKEGFEIAYYAGGHQPFYPPIPDKPDATLAERRIDCDVLVTKHAAFETKWYFSLADHQLLGCETLLSEYEDPCVLYFSNYKPLDGRELPHRIDVVFGDQFYGTIYVDRYLLGK